jgi:hypothetical protein
MEMTVDGCGAVKVTALGDECAGFLTNDVMKDGLIIMEIDLSLVHTLDVSRFLIFQMYRSRLGYSLSMKV